MYECEKSVSNDWLTQMCSELLFQPLQCEYLLIFFIFNVIKLNFWVVLWSWLETIKQFESANFCFSEIITETIFNGQLNRKAINGLRAENCLDS